MEEMKSIVQTVNIKYQFTEFSTILVYEYTVCTIVASLIYIHRGGQVMK